MNGRRAFVTATVLAGLFATACDQSSTRSTSQSSDAAATERPGTARALAVDARHPDRSAPVALGVTPVGVPQRARAGSRVRANFQTRPDSSCQLEVVYQDGARSRRFPPMTADRLGFVAWSWIVEDAAAGHLIRALVVCSGGQRGQADIRIT